MLQFAKEVQVINEQEYIIFFIAKYDAEKDEELVNRKVEISVRQKFHSCDL